MKTSPSTGIEPSTKFILVLPEITTTQKKFNFKIVPWKNLVERYESSLNKSISNEVKLAQLWKLQNLFKVQICSPERF